MFLCSAFFFFLKKLTEGFPQVVWAFRQMTEGRRKDVLPFCKLTEVSRKLFELSVK